jgi:hypothetical protein
MCQEFQPHIAPHGLRRGVENAAVRVQDTSTSLISLLQTQACLMTLSSGRCNSPNPPSDYRSCVGSMPSVEPMFLRIRSDTSGFSSHSSASTDARTSAGTMIRRQLHSNHTPLHTIPSRMPYENVRDSATMSCLHCRPLPRVTHIIQTR